MQRVIPQFSKYLITTEGTVTNRSTGFGYVAFRVKDKPSVTLRNDLGNRVTRTIQGLLEVTFPELYEVTHTGIVYHEAGSFLNCSDNPLEWTDIQRRIRSKFVYEASTGILSHLDGTRAGWGHEGYREVYFEGKEYKEHRLIVLYMLGKFHNEEAQVDHVNQVKDDNRWCNLRIVNSTANSMNMSYYSNNNSGTMGVGWHKKQQKWVARIMVNKKPIQLGSFENKEDAVKARKDAEQKYGFHANHGS